MNGLNNLKRNKMRRIYFLKLCDGWEIGFFGWILEFKKK